MSTVELSRRKFLKLMAAVPVVVAMPSTLLAGTSKLKNIPLLNKDNYTDLTMVFAEDKKILAYNKARSTVYNDKHIGIDVQADVIKTGTINKVKLLDKNGNVFIDDLQDCINFSTHNIMATEIMVVGLNFVSAKE